MLEQIPVGEGFEIWPPHITIVPWFPCDDANKLDQTLSGVALKHQSFEILAGRIEEWGKKEKFKVQKIDDPSNDLHRLHWDILHSLEKNGFPVHQKDFLGEKYDPHIALRNRLQLGIDLERGAPVQIKNFSLFKQIRLKKSGRMIKSLVRDYELSR
jgi:2'-5' RNA ligase